MESCDERFSFRATLLGLVTTPFKWLGSSPNQSVSFCYPFIFVPFTPSSGCQVMDSTTSSDQLHEQGSTFPLLHRQTSVFTFAACSLALSGTFHFLGQVVLRSLLSRQSLVAWEVANSQHILHSLALLILAFYPPPYYAQVDHKGSSGCGSPYKEDVVMPIYSSLGSVVGPFSPNVQTCGKVAAGVHSVLFGRKLMVAGLPLMCGSLYWLCLTELRARDPLWGYWRGWRPMDFSLILVAGAGAVTVAIGWILVIRGLWCA